MRRFTAERITAKIFARSIGSLAGSVALTFRVVAAPLLRSPALRSHTPGQLATRICSDQKRIWTCPPAIVCGNGWKQALAVVGTTALLIMLDPIDTPPLQQRAYQGTATVRVLNRILSGRNMALLINAAPLGLFIGGLIFRNAYAWQTALLAGEAALDAEIIAITMKHIDRRMRPIEVGVAGDFRRTWFRTKNRDLDGAGCFPSGHTASAFAMATVFAERYPNHRLMGRAAYAVAGIIGASRLNARAHFPSDVFFGASLGYSISHFVVMRRKPGTERLSA